jgi:hypothetical protein
LGLPPSRYATDGDQGNDAPGDDTAIDEAANGQ